MSIPPHCSGKGFPRIFFNQEHVKRGNLVPWFVSPRSSKLQNNVQAELSNLEAKVLVKDRIGVTGKLVMVNDG